MCFSATASFSAGALLLGVGTLTLRHWVQRLEANRDAALREVDEPTYRVWRLYMAACALDFEAGTTGVYQILASKPNRGAWPLPLTRSDLYAGNVGVSKERPQADDIRRPPPEGDRNTWGGPALVSYEAI